MYLCMLVCIWEAFSNPTFCRKYVWCCCYCYNIHTFVHTYTDTHTYTQCAQRIFSAKLNVQTECVARWFTLTLCIIDEQKTGTDKIIIRNGSNDAGLYLYMYLHWLVGLAFSVVVGPSPTHPIPIRIWPMNLSTDLRKSGITRRHILRYCAEVSILCKSACTNSTCIYRLHIIQINPGRFNSVCKCMFA